MKTEEIIGLLGILLGLFLFGMIINLNYISLSILLLIGAVIFSLLYFKNNYATFGLTILLFALLFYLFSPFKTQSTQLPEYYIPTIVLFLIVIFGFAIAYKASS